MGTTKIKFETIDANNKTSVKSYGYANPDSTDYTLKSFVTGANALSKNRVGKIYRINTRDITSAAEETEPVQVEGVSVGVTSTSNFFSTNAETFHTFLQAALDADTHDNEDSNTVLSIFVDNDNSDDEIFADIAITYGDLRTLLNNNTATVQSFVTLLNNYIAGADNPPNVTASFANNTLTFTDLDNNGVYVDVQVGVGDTGEYILHDLYDNATDQSIFDTESDYAFELDSANA